MKYSFDTSSLSNAWYDRYPIDVFPVFWEQLTETILSGLVVAHLTVIKELEFQDDELRVWLKQNKGLEFPPSEHIQVLARNIQDKFPKLVRPSAKVGADPFVIAVAKQCGMTVVSEEILTSSPSKNQGQIPFVCIKYDVRHINLLGFMRERKWQFN